ncbi:Nascent polypeptide-associated complex protein [Candidatus Pacearchaeota archaeon]|nr:Nascent polypeptide-associated complex protein [Candidatus Pacearchaeota archaeon]
MFGSMNPKKMQAMMKQLGISQQEVDASQVIIKKNDGSKIVIDNPSVLKVNMSGQETFQISGDISESETDNNEESEDSNAKLEEDIQTIVEQTGISKEEAAIELEKHDFDLAETIIELTNKRK